MVGWFGGLHVDDRKNDLLVRARAKIITQSAKAAAATEETRAGEETLLRTMRANLIQLEIQALMASDDAFSTLSLKLTEEQNASS